MRRSRSRKRCQVKRERGSETGSERHSSHVHGANSRHKKTESGSSRDSIKQNYIPLEGVLQSAALADTNSILRLLELPLKTHTIEIRRPRLYNRLLHRQPSFSAVRDSRTRRYYESTYSTRILLTYNYIFVLWTTRRH